MKLFHKALISSAVLLCATSANAAYISFDSQGALDGSGFTTTVAGATIVDFNSGMPANYVGDGAVKSGFESGKFAAPFGDSTNYLSVAWPNSAGKQTATFGGGSYNYFGLYWGSMDAYNTLSFYNGDTLLESITGDDVIVAGTTLGDQMSLGSNRYVNFRFGTSFDRVVFQTNGYAFESDNHAYANVSVPEPGTLGLFALALMGASVIGRRRVAPVIAA